MKKEKRKKEKKPQNLEKNGNVSPLPPPTMQRRGVELLQRIMVVVASVNVLTPLLEDEETLPLEAELSLKLL